MDTPTVPAPLAEGGVPAGRCQMCEHPAADHDATSRRFCAATAAGAVTRGCICR